jgi:hypothetical protein
MPGSHHVDALCHRNRIMRRADRSRHFNLNRRTRAWSCASNFSFSILDLYNAACSGREDWRDTGARMMIPSTCTHPRADAPVQQGYSSFWMLAATGGLILVPATTNWQV